MPPPVLPDNRFIWAVYGMLETQWYRHEMSGTRARLDYAAFIAAFRAMDPEATGVVMEDYISRLKIIEGAMLAIQADQQYREAQAKEAAGGGKGEHVAGDMDDFIYDEADET